SKKISVKADENKARAESIFAKYRNRESTTSNATESNSSLSSTPTGSVFHSSSSSTFSARKDDQPVTSTPAQSRGTSRDYLVTRMCSQLLSNSLASLQENSDPFLNPMHEKILSDAQNLKTNLSAIKHDIQQTDDTSDEKGW
ncbi:uncharacterized protein LOC110242746, partial [Exaiptasia diaphana]|uniref:Uncharacterized protein n=1 Tax=Exaiptasia diaphana TaxID=2652724 RepID=A0A913XHB3_EXADI